MSDDTLRKFDREVEMDGNKDARSRRARELARIGRNVDAGRDLHEILRNEPTNEAARAEARASAPLSWTALVAMHNGDLLVHEPGQTPVVLTRIPLAKDHGVNGETIRDMTYLNGEFHVLYRNTVTGIPTSGTVLSLSPNGGRTTHIPERFFLTSMHALHDLGELGFVYARRTSDPYSRLATTNGKEIARMDGLIIADLLERRISSVEPQQAAIPSPDEDALPVQFIEVEKNTGESRERRYNGTRHGIHIENDSLYFQDSNGNFSSERDRTIILTSNRIDSIPIPATSRWSEIIPRNYVENPYQLIRSMQNRSRNATLVEVPITIAETLRALAQKYERKARR